MSARAAIFLAEWLRDYVLPGPYPQGSAAEAVQKRDRLIKDGHQLGISSAEFEEEVGDLHIYLRQKLDETTEAAARRMGETGAIDV